jgi:hypothetical protein
LRTASPYRAGTALTAPDGDGTFEQP